MSLPNGRPGHRWVIWQIGCRTMGTSPAGTTRSSPDWWPQWTEPGDRPARCSPQRLRPARTPWLSWSVGDADRLDDLADEWPLFGDGNCGRFPAWETDSGERLVHDEVFGQRIRLLKTLAAPDPATQPQLIATNIQSLLQGVPSVEQLDRATRRLSVGRFARPGTTSGLAQRGRPASHFRG